MKHFFSFLLVFVLLMSSAIAETPGEQETRAFTADEQAYDVYLDITQAYSDSVLYLEELGVLWNKVNETGSKKIDYLWVSDYVAADFKRFVALQRYTESFYGISDAQDMLVQLFSLAKAVEEKTDVIWLYLSILQDANYLRNEADIKQKLDNAMAGIRSLMAMDREYPFLKDLQTYYKDAVLLYEYIADFSDNYTGFNAKLDDFQKNKTSWAIDFEFIFNPDDFDYVREVRNAEKAEEIEAIYQRAVELEDNGKYAEAIEVYQQCVGYKDSDSRMQSCRERDNDSKKNKIYQDAIAKETSGQYAEAIKLYASLGQYQDCEVRISTCLDETVKTYGSWQFHWYNNQNQKKYIDKFALPIVQAYLSNKLISDSDLEAYVYVQSKTPYLRITQNGIPLITNTSSRKQTIKVYFTDTEGSGHTLNGYVPANGYDIYFDNSTLFNRKGTNFKVTESQIVWNAMLKEGVITFSFDMPDVKKTYTFSAYTEGLGDAQGALYGAPYGIECGTVIQHKTYGEGTIQSISGGTTDNGTKWVSLYVNFGVKGYQSVSLPEEKGKITIK